MKYVWHISQDFEISVRNLYRLPLQYKTRGVFIRYTSKTDMSSVECQAAHGECTAVQEQWARVRAGPGGPEHPGHGVRRQRTVQSGLHAGWCTANVGSNEFCAQQSLVLCNTDEFRAQRMSSVHSGRVPCTVRTSSVHRG